MSVMQAARAAIADAVNNAAIDNVWATEHAPTAPLPGSVWPQWVNLTPAQYLGTVDVSGSAWDVLLTLPADNTQTTNEATDLWLEPVLQALSPLGPIGEVVPVTVTLADTSQPGIRIRLTL